MSWFGSVADRMDYIQKLFLDTELAVEKLSDTNAVFQLLDEEPPEYRSIAYESASMAIAVKDLSCNKELEQWFEFSRTAALHHGFHTDIGLGWGFAKTGLEPVGFLKSANDVNLQLVMDGLGYFYGLFRGRNTLKNKIVPEFADNEFAKGFDEGLGRRFWYMVRGEVSELVPLLRDFDKSRHPDLWRGVGIACGYVGGCTIDTIQTLSAAAMSHHSQFAKGMEMAATSRTRSRSMNEELRKACELLSDFYPQPVNR